MIRVGLAGIVFAAISPPTAAQAEWYLIRNIWPDRGCSVVNREPLAGEQLVPGPLSYGELCDRPVTSAQWDPATGAFQSRSIAEQAQQCTFRCRVWDDDDDDDDDPPVVPRQPEPEPEPQ